MDLERFSRPTCCSICSCLLNLSFSSATVNGFRDGLHTVCIVTYDVYPYMQGDVCFTYQSVSPAYPLFLSFLSPLSLPNPSLLSFLCFRSPFLIECAYYWRVGAYITREGLRGHIELSHCLQVYTSHHLYAHTHVHTYKPWACQLPLTLRVVWFEIYALAGTPESRRQREWKRGSNWVKRGRG